MKRNKILSRIGNLPFFHISANSEALVVKLKYQYLKWNVGFYGINTHTW